MASSNPFGDPQAMALMGLAQGLLAAGQTTTVPTSFGGALAQGVGGALSGAMNAQKYQLGQQQLALTGLQAAHMKYQADFTNWLLTGRRGPPPTPPSVDAPGFQPQSQSPSAPSAIPPAAAASGPTAPPPAYGQPGFQPASPTASPQEATPQDTLSKLPQYAQDAIAYNYAMPGSGAIIMDANKPIPLRAGPLVSPTGQVIFQNTPPVAGVNFNYGPGGRVSSAEPISGYAPTVAGIEGAKKGATAAFEFEPVTLAGGQQIGVPKSIAAKGPDAIKQYVSQLSGGASAATPAAKPASNDPWQTIPQMKVPTGVGQSTYQKETQEKTAAFADELAKKYGDLATQANTRKAFNDQALELIDKADTGPGSEFIAGMKNWALQIPGVKESDFANTPTAYQALNKDLVNAALQRGRQLFGARFTQSEVGIMLTKAAPSPVQTKAAMKFLLDSDNAQLNYQVQQGNDLGRYISQGGDPHQFESWYSKNFPMSKAVENVKLSAPAGGGDLTPSERQELDQLRKRFGKR